MNKRNRHLRVGIIGGSLSGLFAGRALQTTGHNVYIFERRNAFISGGGITVTSPLMDYVSEYNIFPDEKDQNKNLIPTITTSAIHNNSQITQKVHPKTVRLHTTYDCLYHNLLNKELKNNYFHGKNLKNIALNDDENQYLMKIEFDDGTSFDCDLVIGADGIGSKSRDFIKSNKLKSLKYAGYVAWRGVVEGNDVDKKLNKISNWKQQHQWMLFHGENTQYLNYIVPNYYDINDNNNLLYNWVWYVKYTQNEIDNSPFLVDKYGKKRLLAMPKGLLNEKSLEYVAKLADNLLEKTCAELVKLTKEPFYQIIYDYKCNQMAQYMTNGHGKQLKQGGIVLIGNASFVLRPHITKATSKAAGDALTLQKYLTKYVNNEINLRQALDEYNKERMVEGISLSDKSIELGNKVVLQTHRREFTQEYVRSSKL